MWRTTNHLRARMSQRGITAEMIDLVTRFGVNEGERVALRRADLELLVQELQRIQRTALKALDKGGVIVVEDGGKLLTTYNADSYKRPEGHRSKRHKARRPNGYQWGSR